MRFLELLKRTDSGHRATQNNPRSGIGNPPGHRIEGNYAGDALLFRLADGAFLDGFRVEANRNEPDLRYSPRNDLCRHAGQEVLDKARALAIVMW